MKCSTAYMYGGWKRKSRQPNNFFLIEKYRDWKHFFCLKVWLLFFPKTADFMKLDMKTGHYVCVLGCKDYKALATVLGFYDCFDCCWIASCYPCCSSGFVGFLFFCSTFVVIALTIFCMTIIQAGGQVKICKRFKPQGFSVLWVALVQCLNDG